MAADSCLMMKIILFSVCLFNLIIYTTAVSYIDFQTKEDCKTGIEEYHEFYDISQLRCRTCSETTVFQTVTDDGKNRKIHSLFYVFTLSLQLEHQYFNIVILLIILRKTKMAVTYFLLV